MPRDDDEAARYFRVGEAKSDAVSLNGLGVLHLRGSGGAPHDAEAALKFFQVRPESVVARFADR